MRQACKRMGSAFLVFFLMCVATCAFAQAGTVAGFQKISEAAGGFTGVLDTVDEFGFSACSLGDLDSDGVTDIAVGARIDDDGGNNQGAVWILFLKTDGSVKSHQKISDTAGGFTGTLDTAEEFGSAVEALGDLDGDGVTDLAVGAKMDDDGGGNRGAVWILFLNSDGTVKAHQKISSTAGGFGGTIDNYDEFGIGLANLGDLDDDGVIDLAVGAKKDDDGGVDQGAVWILFLNSDGTVKSHQKISETQGGFTGVLNPSDWFSHSLDALGDLDGDGVTDLAVGSRLDDDGGTDRGAIWILFLNSNGTVKGQQKISDTEGNFTGVLDDKDSIGYGIDAVGDLDGDGVTDLAAGAFWDDDGGGNRGAVWILFLNSNGTVKSHQKISDTEGNFLGTLIDGDQLGSAVASLGDVDGNGVIDLAVGALYDDDGGSNQGAMWILFLGPEFVIDEQKISETEGGFAGVLDTDDQFSFATCSLGDLDGDGVTDIAVGARVDDDGGGNKGAVWILFLNADGTVKSHQKISDTAGGFTGTLSVNDEFGSAVEALGDLDGDSVTDLAVGAKMDDDGGADRGAVWILFLNADGTVKSHQKISDTQGGFTGTLDGDEFGISLANLGDLDGDSVIDLAVGEKEDDDGGTEQGAVWILFLNSNGTVKSHQKISETQGGFSGVLNPYDWFSFSIGSLGDLDGDGVTDIAVGSRLDDDGDTECGAVWILFLNSNGTVKGQQKISATEGNFFGVLDYKDHFGFAVDSVGDLDYDGAPDLAVGAFWDDDGGGNCGAVWILFLNSDGTVKSYKKISSQHGNFEGALDGGDNLGSAVASIGDLDSNGVTDLAIGALYDDDGGADQGAVWIAFLDMPPPPPTPTPTPTPLPASIRNPVLWQLP